jgi:hypothetical protein
MSNAALTPHVRKIVVCDEVVLSEIEEQVFTLEGVRQGFGAESFPSTRALGVYLVLSYLRGGRFSGEVKLVPADEKKTIRMSKFSSDFDASPGVETLAVDLGPCTFPAPGFYSIQVVFWTTSGPVMKGEEPFQVWQLEE